MIGVVHVALGAAAILAGGWIFLTGKGTRATSGWGGRTSRAWSG